jgi:type II secretory pathway pseudopilin PulG
MNAHRLTNARKWSKGLTLFELAFATVIMIAILGVIVAMLLPATRMAREPARRSQCKNNLKQIGLALHNYVDVYHALPPAYTVDADGKPLHSWRTLILPYLDEHQLYNKIDLRKAWDDPANAETFKTNVWAYRCPSAVGAEKHSTYLAIVTSNSCFRATEPRPLSEITDGAANTLMVIEVDAEHAVPWMAPRDADESLLLSLGASSNHSHTGGMHALFVDGTVRFLTATLPADKLRALISIAGNEPVSD